MESKLSTLTKEKAKAEHKLTQLNVKVAKLTSDLKDEMTMNENLRKNQVKRVRGAMLMPTMMARMRTRVMVLPRG